MTHSLHRSGSSESLAGDYILIVMAAEENQTAVEGALAKATEILLRAGPCNVGSSKLGMNALLGFDRNEFLARVAESDSVACAFHSLKKLREAVAALKEADLGLSITVSGLTEETLRLSRELGLRPHTVNLSLGVLGDTRGLPDEGVLELTTMCGHCRIGAELARQALRDVAEGIRTPREASEMLGRPCTCGLFNVDRSAELLSTLASRP